MLEPSTLKKGNLCFPQPHKEWENAMKKVQYEEMLPHEFEQAMAEEGIGTEGDEWPQY